MIDIRVGDCRELLRKIPDCSVNMCVTSPPYFGLRDYGHEGQMGLEQTPEAFVLGMVEVFREVRRVLRNDGTLWLNIGDSYAAQRGGTNMPAETLAGGVSGKGDDAAHRGRQRAGGPSDLAKNRHKNYMPHRNAHAIGLKHKDLVGIPWMLAFALRADGWCLRQDIIWHKPNPMPESVKDRCTKSHEYLFMLSKSPNYHFDSEAIKEPAVRSDQGAWSDKSEKQRGHGRRHAGFNGRYAEAIRENGAPTTRNRRDVWTIATKPFKDAHFATFPPALVEPCVLAGCPEGGTVLDPFFGAGTTALVARQHGRRTIGLELNPRYARIARRRLGLPETLCDRLIGLSDALG